MTLPYVLGFDMSAWQDSNATPARPDFRKAYAQNKRFALIKCSQNGYKDEDFDYNWQAAKEAGLLRSAFHFFEYRPERAPLSAQAQAEAFSAYLPVGDPGELPPSLDLEKAGADWPELPDRATCYAYIQGWSAVVERAFPGYWKTKPMMYLNLSTILYRLAPIPDWLKAHPLWYAAPIAADLGRTVEETIELHSYKPKACPNYWPDWTFWQYSWKGDGYACGMESADLDLDFFNGSMEDLRAWATLPEAPQPPEPEPASDLTALEAAMLKLAVDQGQQAERLVVMQAQLAASAARAETQGQILSQLTRELRSLQSAVAALQDRGNRPVKPPVIQ